MADLAEASASAFQSTRWRFIEWEAHSFATASPTPEAPPVIRAFAPARKTDVGEAIVNELGDAIAAKLGTKCKEAFFNP